MKNLTEGFPYHIYCDMDGVLVEFIGPMLEHMKRSIHNPRWADLAHRAIELLGRHTFEPNDISRNAKHLPEGQAARAYMRALIHNDVAFWANLPWAKGGQELWDHIKRYDPSILTTPMPNCLGSRRGKAEWVKQNLDINVKRVHFSETKYKYALNGPVPNVLIDDFCKNTKPFIAHGGIAIQHITGNTEDTIAQLEIIKSDSEINQGYS